MLLVSVFEMNDPRAFVCQLTLSVPRIDYLGY